MRSLPSLAACLMIVAPLPAFPQTGKAGSTPPATAPVGPPTPKADEGTFYALGAALGGNLKSLRLTPAEVEVVKRGFGDSLTGQKLEADPSAYEDNIKKLADARIAETSKANKEAGKAYAAKAATEKGAQKTTSGVIYGSLHEGTGAAPGAADTVKVSIVGKLTDGTVFEDGSAKPPVELALNQVFPCFSEGIAKMKVGGSARLVCPSDTAFGDQGRPPSVPPGATIVFEVKLVDAKPPPRPAGHGGMGPGHGG
jgi:FKBP-type peptidyl-prolyl cis-trans isomerase FkpA